jgi:hypothetical protein
MRHGESVSAPTYRVPVSGYGEKHDAVAMSADTVTILVIIAHQQVLRTPKKRKVFTRVKIHKITPAQGKERGDVEIRDYVVLQKPRDGTDCLPPPRTLILDFTMTHTRYGRSQLSSLGQVTHNSRSDGPPEPMEISGRRLGQKFVITHSCILIAQTR